MLSIITNYLPILITAFIYVPFGDDIVPWLSGQSRRLLGPLGGKYLYASESFQVDSARLRDEVIALALTGQVSSFFEENVVPVLKRKFQGWYRDYKASRSKDTVLLSIIEDDPSEAAFLKTARDQATREEYNVQDDIAEIVLQFGYLALFSPVWPLISIGFFVNNIIEIRTDFIKIATEHQRPAPVRADGIGPWINSLDFLTWAGSISTGAVVHLFGTDSIAGGAWWALPITIFISEHVFTALRSIVRTVLHRIGSEQIRKERDERYAMRVKYLKDIEAHRKTKSSLTVEERIHRKSVRVLDMDTFFTKQIEQGSSAAFGVKLIHACAKAQGDGEHDKRD
jgi:anoctamin-10